MFSTRSGLSWRSAQHFSDLLGSKQTHQGNISLRHSKNYTAWKNARPQLENQYNIFKNKFIYFVYVFLAALGLLAARGLSLVAASRGYSSLWCAGFSVR